MAKSYVFEKEEIDIRKIIDDAMEKKDRTVSIYIGHSGVSINVQPYEKEEPHWIYKPQDSGWDFECSACGGDSKTYTTYCPYCGEQMKRSKFEVEEVVSDAT